MSVKRDNARQDIITYHCTAPVIVENVLRKFVQEKYPSPPLRYVISHWQYFAHVLSLFVTNILESCVVSNV